MQYSANVDGILSDNTTPTVTDNNNSKINYFLPGPIQDADSRASTEITQWLLKIFKDLFTRIGF